MKISNIKYLTAALLLIVSLTPAAFAGLRIAPKDASPFYLKEVATEDSTAWYDAETWLMGYKGETEYSLAEHRLTFRKGRLVAELKAEAPFATRDGRGVNVVDQPRLHGGRLVVSERLIRANGQELTGLDPKIEIVVGEPTKRIVIDPAYGGDDFGPRGADGTPAKKPVLAFAKALAESFYRAGYAVRLTRTDDVPINTVRRAAIANNWNADLFLSVEVSGDRRPQARGFEVFYPPWPSPELDSHRWEAAQKGVAERSRQWAEFVRTAVGATTSNFDRGAGELPSQLLSAIDCPAALLVAGNVAWGQEADILTNENARRRLADELVNAANKFLSR